MTRPLTLLSATKEEESGVDNVQSVTLSQNKSGSECLMITPENLNALHCHCYYGKLQVGDWVVKRSLESGEIRISGPFQSLEVAQAYIHAIS